MSKNHETGLGAIGEDDLQAFIDGRLDEARAVSVEAWLAANPDKAHAFKADKRIRDDLRVAAATHLEPIPTTMRLAELRRAGANAHRRVVTRAVASVVLLMVGGVGGWAVRDGLSPPSTLGTMADATAAWRVFANDQIQPVEFTADNRVRALSVSTVPKGAKFSRVIVSTFSLSCV